MKLRVLLLIAGILCGPLAPTLIAHGKVYLVLGSDTAIWDGMDVGRYHCHYSPTLYTDPTRNAYKVMDPAFRSQIRDSYGSPLKLTWWMMCGNIFRWATNTDIPHPNTMTLYLMKRYHGAAIRDFGDELTLHYHTFVWSDYNGDGKWYWNQAKSFAESADDFQVTLAEMLLEEQVFPVSFRSGWHYMDDNWQNTLDSLLPYSLHNDWPAVRQDTTEPIDNVYDWSRAPSTFVPYHPSPTDYQVPGPGRGWNVRSRYMSAVDSAFMSRIFAQANSGTDQVVCLWAHLPEADFLDNIRRVDASAHTVAPLYPNVQFQYCTAVEAMQAWRGCGDTTGPHLTMKQEGEGETVHWIISTDEPIFQFEPFVTVKDRYEQYRILPCTRLSGNVWRTEPPVSHATLAKAGAAVTDTSGNCSIIVLPYLPDDIYVEDGDAGYNELAGTWGTSTQAAWGTTSRVATLSASDSAKVRWTPTITSACPYNVFVQSPLVTNPARHVMFRLLEGESVVDSLAFGNGVPPATWTYLATVRPSSTANHSIEMIAKGATQPGTVLAADVVKYSPLVRERWLIVPDAIDAGDVIVEETTLLRVRLRNMGIQPLSVASAISVHGLVSVLSVTPFVIPPMSETSLELSLTATQPGPLLDSVTITSDDPVHAQQAIAVKATGRHYFVVVDDRDSLAYHETGAWYFSVAQAYGSTSRYAYPAAGVSASFIAMLRKEGVYRIEEIVPTTVNASIRARYVLSVNGARVDSVFLDQNEGSGAWVGLFEKMLAESSAVVLAITDAMSPPVSGKVLRADAIRFQWLQSAASADWSHDAAVPSRYFLDQNFPNPFNAQTTVSFELPEATHVCIEIYNLLGQRVAVLVDSDLEVGYFSKAVDAAQWSSGIYFLRMTAGSYQQTRKMSLVK